MFKKGLNYAEISRMSGGLHPGDKAVEHFKERLAEYKASKGA